MQRQFRKAISTLLTLAMVIGLFAAMPMTANAMSAQNLRDYINAFDHGFDSAGVLHATAGSIGGVYVVSVGGSVFEATKPMELNIDEGVTVIWNADYSGKFNGFMITLSGGGTFMVAGGSIINNGNGCAIASSTTVNVSGGTVATMMGATAIYSGGSAVNVSGGFVFACGMGAVEDVIRVQGGTPNISGDAVVCAWKKPAGIPSYVEGTSTNLKANSGATATWGRSGSQCGIRYVKGANAGFFEIIGVTFGSAVCQIGSDLYPTLVSAIEDVPIGGSSQTVIKLLRDITHPDALYIGVKKITFELNGFDLVIANTLELAQSTVDYTGGKIFRVESKVTDAGAGSHKYAVLATKESSLVLTSVEITDVGTGTNRRVTAVDAGDRSSVSVEGNVKATSNGQSGSYACGVSARNGSNVTVKGNITSSDCSASVGGSEPTTVTVDGTITANPPHYVNVDEHSNAYRTAEEFTTPTTKTGYLTYSKGTNTIWVKDTGKAAQTPDKNPPADKFAANVAKEGEKLAVTVTGKDAGLIVAVMMCPVDAPYLEKIDDYWKQQDKYYVVMNDKGTGRFEFNAPEGDGEWELRYFVEDTKGKLAYYSVEALPQFSIANQLSKPELKIDYINGRLTNFINYVMYGSEYSFNGGIAEDFTDPSKTYRDINEEWYGTTVSVVRKGQTKTVIQLAGGNIVGVTDYTISTDSEPQYIYIKDRPAAPTVGKTDCTTPENNNGTLTGVNSAMEYKNSGTDVTWKPITGTTVTGLPPGTYNVRLKAVVGTSFSSKNATVTILYTYMPKPEAKIDYIDEKLTNLVGGGKYSFNGGAAETLPGISPVSKAINASWFGTTVSIVRKGEGTIKDSAAQSIYIPNRPAAPTTVGSTPCTTVKNNNGTLTGLTSAMEYQKSGTDRWWFAGGTTVTGLSSGLYHVRVRAVAGTSFKSTSINVNIEYSYVPFSATSRERYHFANAGVNFQNRYYVSDSDFIKLANYVKQIYGNSTFFSACMIGLLQNERNSSWKGSCFGMAATAILDKKGQINMKNIGPGPIPRPADLWEVPASTAIQSAINYYHLSQYIPFIYANFDVPYDSGLSLAQKLEGLVNNAKNKKIMQMGFQIPNWGGHAIVIFDYEAGTDGTHKLRAYDNNHPDHDVIVTVSADYKTCYVGPYEGTVSKIRYTANFGFYNDIKIAGILDSDIYNGKKFASTADVKNIAGDMDMNTQLSINARSIVTVTDTAGKTLIYNPSTGDFSGTMPTLSFSYVEAATADGGSGSSTIIIEVPDSDTFTFETDGQGLEVSVVSPGIFAAASSDKANKATVTNGEGVTVSGNGAIDFKASLGLNSDVCDMVSLEGKANGEASLRYDESGGALAKGDFTKETTLTVFSDIVNIDEIKFTSESGEVLVTKEAGKITVKDPSGQSTPESTKPALKNPFTDVTEKNWYYKDVMYAYGAGLINGKSATLFAPEDNLTYAEAVKLAACMHQLHTTGKVTLAVGGGAWYQSYVDYAKKNKIISKDYDWNAPASRAGYMEIFANALPEEALAAANSVADNSIPDVPATHPQAWAIYRLYRAGILQGVDAAHNCRPDANIMRCEVAAILTRMMDPGARVEFSLK